MKLNCKPGDLAYVTRDGFIAPGGAVVEVVGYLGEGVHLESRTVYQNVWYVRWQGRTHGHDGKRYGIPDAFLRPIRPSDDPDETLTWAGLPADRKQGVLA